MASTAARWPFDVTTWICFGSLTMRPDRRSRTRSLLVETWREAARNAVEAIVQASQELDACRDVGAYARRSMRRLQQCAKNRIKVVESQLPGPLPAKPQIADAEAAFASAGLKTPDAVEDCQ